MSQEAITGRGQPLAVSLSTSLSLTVILPTYNERENIPILIAGILACVRTPVKVLVVDDNSPDGTWQVATAAIWLGLLFAGASIMVERRVAHRVAPELAIEAVDRWCYRANLLSYAAFIGVVLAWWAYQAGRPA